MTDLVTVIIPVYNVKKFLDECVISVINQSFRNLEIVLVDDGSNDGSDELCDLWKQKDERIRVIHKSNAGLGMARNSGLEVATGKYVTFVDSDDIIEEKHIEVLYQNLFENNSDICYCGHKSFSERGINEFKNILSGEVIAKPDIIKSVVPLMCGKINPHINDSLQMSVCMALYSLELIRNNDIHFHSERELISEDFVFNIDILSYARRVSFSESCGYLYRTNMNSLTTSYNPTKYDRHKQFAKEIISRTKELEIFSDCKQRIYSNFLSGVWFDIKGEAKNAKNHSFIYAIKRIHLFCNDTFTHAVLKEYDLSPLPKDTRLIRWLMKHKFAFLLFCAAIIKN